MRDGIIAISFSHHISFIPRIKLGILASEPMPSFELKGKDAAPSWPIKNDHLTSDEIEKS